MYYYCFISDCSRDLCLRDSVGRSLYGFRLLQLLCPVLHAWRTVGSDAHVWLLLSDTTQQEQEAGIPRVLQENTLHQTSAPVGQLRRFSSTAIHDISQLQDNLLFLSCLKLVSLVCKNSYVLFIVASSQCVASDCPDSSLW